MNLYQFSHHEVSFEQQIKDLQNIGFLSTNYQGQSDTDLLKTSLAKLFPEQTSRTSLLEALDRLAINEAQTAKNWYEADTINLAKTDFYNLVLQLIGFEVNIDFKLNTGFKYLMQLQLPTFSNADVKTIDNQESFIRAFYYLLTLRCKNGLNYLDNLGNRGFFNHYFEAVKPKFVFFNGRLQPVFNANETIREIVYVQSDLDTDKDGKPDLLSTTIFRPKATYRGLKVPVLYTANPYFKGTNDMKDYLHHVNQNIPVKPATSTTYEDIHSDMKQPTVSIDAVTDTPTSQAEVKSTEDNIYSLNDYFLARGLATVYAGGIGTRDSDGLRTSGSPAETQSTIAIIEWLHGDRLAFTNKTNKQPIEAWWCNGNVAMTGKSYLGTMATAAATTGVAGLKTVISESAISSWYDYYRDNGLVIAPVDCQGEDTDALAIDTLSRLKDVADYQRVKTAAEAQLSALTKGQDRRSGNYNHFWDARNYRKQVANIKCPVLLVHGLNDWNVKLRNPEKLWRELRDHKIPAKIFLHQGQHIYMNDIRSIDYNDLINLWLSDKLLGYQNDSDHILPRVLIQDNAEPETWHRYRQWCDPNDAKLNFYFAKEHLTTTPASEPIVSFVDDGTQQFLTQTKDEHLWQQQILQDDSPYANNRLQFKSEQQDRDFYLDGNAVLTVQIASDHDHGFLSAMLVDYGIEKRLKATPDIVMHDGLKLGYNWKLEDLKEFELADLSTDFKMITKGHINLQNRKTNYRNEAVKPGNFYTLHFELQPMHYHLLAGHQLGIVLYATDMGMTLRGNEGIEYTIDLNDCRLEVPYRK